MEFIEFSHFAKNLSLLGDDDEYLDLQLHLMERPESGAVIPGSGGLRKLRWAGSGRGKRGGLRLIYYYVTAEGQILLLHLYAKNEMEDLDSQMTRQLKQLVTEHLV
ncbi:MAG: type II toxin-antitoxin system RelE/ParE family toxin [Prosthecobacter sp.]|uniref:type II toxin-antitoxin system RelE/ParE family toxin n=1 Tax=Prosthecobacter sp. TaxID=1965333 RepID=UPI0039002068